MIPLRVHYVDRLSSRCGNPSLNRTTDPSKVTCLTCKRLMQGEVK